MPAANGVDACTVALLGVQGELVSGTGTVSVEAVRKSQKLKPAEAQDRALDTARARAEQELRSKVCAGLSPDECAGELTARVDTSKWLDAPDGRWACAVTAVPRRTLGQHTAKFQTQAALSELGVTVRTALREYGVADGLVVDPVQSPEGCTQPEFGFVRQSIEAAVARDTHLLTAQRIQAWHLRLEASLRGTEIQIAPRLVHPDQEHEWLLAPAVFPANTLDPSRTHCAAPVRSRVAPSGLRVAVDLPESVCAGAVFAPEIEVSSPANIEVWSLTPDGTAYRLPVAPGWSGKQALDSFIALPASMPGDETLVAVARPLTEAAKTPTSTTFCKQPQFGARHISASAAVGVRSWRVDTDPQRCPGAAVSDEDLRAAERALRDAPVCSGF